MNRRELVKSFIGLGLFGLMPKTIIAKSTQTNYFIGLGGAGCNIVEEQALQKAKGNYIFINNNSRKNIPSNVRLIEIPILTEYTDECAKAEILLTDEMKNMFSDKNGNYFLYVGLGAMTGSELCKKIIPYLVNEKINFRLVYSQPLNFEGRQRKIKALYAATFIAELSNCILFDFNEYRKE